MKIKRIFKRRIVAKAVVVSFLIKILDFFNTETTEKIFYKTAKSLTGWATSD